MRKAKVFVLVLVGLGWMVGLGWCETLGDGHSKLADSVLDSIDKGGMVLEPATVTIDGRKNPGEINSVSSNTMPTIPPKAIAKTAEDKSPGRVVPPPPPTHLRIISVGN